MSSDIPGQAGPFADEAHTASAPPPPPGPLAYHPPRPARSGWLLPVLVLLAFGGGIGATLWGLPKLEGWWNRDKGSEQAAIDNGSQALLDGRVSNRAPAAATLPADVNPLSVAALEARLAAVSTRLDGISVQANAAGADAARAEGLLIAFATRRALDRGAPLGYLEGELRLRFGDSQPRAVATIINAAHAPVTIADLQAELEEVAPALLGKSGGKTDWWAATRRELANLIIIRKADAPSPVPQQVIARTRLMISSERVNSALREIERLPDHEKADSWIQMARKYNEARRALDVIEAAAILEPRSVPSGARAGSMQVAPPPPVTEDESSGASLNPEPAPTPTPAAPR